VHTRIPFDLRTDRGIATFRSFVEEAADLVVSHGGSLSGEHGDGQSRAELLPRMFSPDLMRAFEELKAIWDPKNRMNPGKIVHPYRLDENLRLGAEYRRPQVETHFRFPEDRDSFAYATERCVGVGECRRLDGGTMCPSFMVTREEAHSTRGRAHLLFETMRGGLREGWRSDAVREALDLCLSCKGCKSDCPVNVDVATYKAEFLSHYYRGRLRPRSAYVFGLLHWWVRIGSLAPWLANWLMRAPVLSRLLKLIAGVAPARELPPLAPVTFRAWWRSHSARNAGGPKVLLWVDTFNDHWQPSVLVAAVDVLEAAGFHVVVTSRSICCGRPLYDYGMLPFAKRMLREILEELRPYIRAAIPVVGLEPSCIAVFRDELGNLFPNDPDARSLGRQSFMLDELLATNGDLWNAPRLERKALVQGHCHQKAIMQLEHHAEILNRVGVEAEILESGCCGMAGGFGYEHSHYSVSVACGERRLLPSVRNAPKDVIIIADGFSCREQIRQHTDRKALHLAQVLQMAKAQGPKGPDGPFPEAGYASAELHVPLRHGLLLSLLLATSLAVVFIAWSSSWPGSGW
jgi:Fe-S oxidoreductase